MDTIRRDFVANPYPRHIFYPRVARPPQWTKILEKSFAAVRSKIDTEAGSHKDSNVVLAILRPGLQRVGFRVELGKAKGQKLPRPISFGEMGQTQLSYDIDAYHQRLSIVMEVEAVRTIRANAIYKDLIQMSLMVDAKYAVIAVPLRYQYSRGVDFPYEKSKEILEAIYASGRLPLPFRGTLLVGY